MDSNVPQNPTKNLRQALWVVLSIVVLIAITTFVYYGGFINSNNSSNVNIEAKVDQNENTNFQQDLMSTPQLLDEEVSGLKIFTEKNNDFSIKTPKDIYLWERDDASEPMYVVLSSSENYVSTLEAEFWVKIFSLKDEIVGLSERDALTFEGGRDALPLVVEEFLTINNLPAYRAFRQVKTGDKLFDDQIATETFTAVEYSFLKNNTLYILRSNITGTHQEYYIDLLDQIAQTFK